MVEQTQPWKIALEQEEARREAISMAAKEKKVQAQKKIGARIKRVLPAGFKKPLISFPKTKPTKRGKLTKKERAQLIRRPTLQRKFESFAKAGVLGQERAEQQALKQLRARRPVSPGNRHQRKLNRLRAEVARYNRMLQEGEVPHDYFLEKVRLKKQKLRLQREYTKRNNLFSKRVNMPQDNMNILSEEGNILKANNIFKRDENNNIMRTDRPSILQVKEGNP